MIKNEQINICIVFNDSDGEYTKKCFPTIFSILENNKEESLRFYFICKGAKQQYIKYLHEIFVTYQQELNIIDDFGDKEYLVEYFKNNNTSSWNYGIFFKLLMPLLLPDHVRKVINFDSDDVIVDGSLREMWNIDIGNYMIASVMGFQKKTGNIKFNLKNPLFRIGGNVYNLDAFRAFDFENKFKAIIQQYGRKLTTPESDILNILCNDRVLYIDEKYNFIPQNYKIYKEGNIAYHFTYKKFFLFKYTFGVHKKYRTLYQKYYDMSKYESKKKFNLLRSLNSLRLLNSLIKKIGKLLYLLKIKQFVEKKLYW